MHFYNELTLLLQSNYPIISILTQEEERLENILKNIKLDAFVDDIYYWDFVQGYMHLQPNSIPIAERNPLDALNFIDSNDTEQKTLFVLKDFSLFYNDVIILRKLRNLSRKLKLSYNTIIITGLDSNIPLLIQYLVYIIVLPLPSETEIKYELIRLAKLFKKPLSNDLLDILVLACKGLSLEQIRRLVFKMLIKFQHFSENSSDLIIAEKKIQIQNSGLLESYPLTYTFDDIGGIDNLKKWLNKRSKSFSKSSLNYGIPYPKGILLVGVQGTGKSISAKSVAHAWKLPLLKLDVGKLFAGVIGESEAKTRQMIQVAEASAPCILWIDEFEKTFQTMSTIGDSGTSNRVLATFLTWLSEKSSSVFIVATANNIKYLPPEMIRKGRFDEIFFLDLPSEKERELIFKVHLSKKRPKTWCKYNISILARCTHLFSGAEIEQIIIESMHNAFYSKREFNTQDLLNTIEQFIPLAFTNNKEIVQLQKWANLGKARRASSEN